MPFPCSALCTFLFMLSVYALLYTVVYIFFLDCFTVFRWAFFLDAFILQLAWCVRPRVVYCAIATRLCTGRNTSTDRAIIIDYDPVLEPEFGCRDRDKMFFMLNFFCSTGFELKTYCVMHDFLTNSSK